MALGWTRYVENGWTDRQTTITYKVEPYSDEVFILAENALKGSTGATLDIYGTTDGLPPTLDENNRLTNFDYTTVDYNFDDLTKGANYMSTYIVKQNGGSVNPLFDGDGYISLLLIPSAVSTTKYYLSDVTIWNRNYQKGSDTFCGTYMRNGYGEEKLIGSSSAFGVDGKIFLLASTGELFAVHINNSNGYVYEVFRMSKLVSPDVPEDLRFRMKIETTGDYKSAISNAVGTEANAKAVVDAFDGWIYSVFTTDNQPPAFYPDTNIPTNFNLDYCTEWYSPIYDFFETKLNEILYTSFFGYPGVKPWKIGAPVGTSTNDTFRVGGVYDYLHIYYEPGSFTDYSKDSKVFFVGTKEVFEDQSYRIDIYVILFYIDSEGVERRQVVKSGYPMTIYTDLDALENMGQPSEPSNNTGTYDDNSDNIQPTEYPLTVDNGGTEQDILVPFNPMGASDAGLITLWKVTLADLDSLGNILWSSDFSSTVSKVFLSPIDAIISLNLIPYGGAEGIGQGVLTYGTDNLALGGYGTGIRPKKLASQFFYVDMGHYIFEEYWASALDYDPYTKIQMYLPFIGSVDLSPDDVMSKRVDLEYVIDTLTGQLAARLYVSPDRATKGSILCTYSGNCSINIPITGANYGEIYRSVISASVNTATSLMSLGSGGGLSNVVSSLGSTAADMVSGSKAKYERAGSIGLTSSYLACLTPFIIITRPKQSLAADYNKYEGYPSNITSKLKGLKGFTVVESIHLDNISATEKELNEIESLLSKGVII